MKGVWRWNRALQNFLLLLVSTVFTLLVAELVLRVFKIAPDVTYTRWSDHVHIIEGPEFRYYERDDSIGLRDSREFDRDSPSTRVLFIGDSFTFGNGVSNDETISFKTEAILNQDTSHSWTVLNAGQPGTGTRAEELQLKRVLNLLNVDAVVLFYFVDNDPYETQQEYAKDGAAQIGPHVDSKWVRVKGVLGQNSAIYRLLRLRLSKVGTIRAFPFTIFDQCDPAKVASFQTMDSLMRASIRGIEQMARERNLVFRVVIIPRREQLSDAVFQKFKQNYGVGQYPYDRFLPQTRVLENVFRPEDIEPLNLLTLLEGADPDKYYYRFDGHFNPAGTSLVAAQVAELIRTSMRPKN